jgi:hypothetical protein
MFGPHILELLAVVGLFLIRFGVPLLISGGVAWWLFRLDAKWRREAPAVYIPTGAPAGAAGPGHSRIIGEPCWVYRACPEQVRDKCPAYLQPDVPCWLARLRNDGRLTGGCRCCSIFATSHVPVAAGD